MKIISEKLDGKLYSIDASGNVTVLLDGMSLSNGMEWSADESLFYHTDSDTSIIREYDFDPVHGKIVFTGRQIAIPGADGFTIDINAGYTFLHKTNTRGRKPYLFG